MKLPILYLILLITIVLSQSDLPLTASELGEIVGVSVDTVKRDLKPHMKETEEVTVEVDGRGGIIIERENIKNAFCYRIKS